MSKYLICIVLVFLLPASVYAQVTEDDKTELYVTDQLRLSLYEQANAQSNIILYLSSGDKLIVEEVDGPYARVEVPSGKIGWVKRGFLVSNPTSNLLLAEVTETNELLKKELEKLNNSKVVLDQYEKDMDAMSSKIEVLKQEKQTAEAMIDNLQQAAEEKQQAEKAKPLISSLKKVALTHWQSIAILVSVVLVLGLLLGKSITQRAIKRKFHGIKVW